MTTDTTAAKHTPGPWKLGVRQPTSDKFIYGQEGAEVADCDRLTNFPDCNLANARLIAAAPELLAELQATETLALELMERAARIDRRLIAATGSMDTPECELGEITRLRRQLSRNRVLIAKATGQA